MTEGMRRLEATVFDALLFIYMGACTVWMVAGQEEGSSSLWLKPSLWVALTAVGVAFSLTSRKLGLTLGDYLSGKKESSTELEILRWWERPWLWGSALFIFITCVVGWRVTQMRLLDLVSQDGFDGAASIFKKLLTPNLLILDKALVAIVETVFMAFMATFLSFPLAFIMSFLAANNLMQGRSASGHFTMRLIYHFMRLIMNFSRSIEPLIWAIIFSVWVGIGPFSGMLALWLHSIVSMAKNYYEQIEAIDSGPMEAMASVGANRLQIIAYGVVPQIVMPFISFTIFRWDINVRMATVIGFVGGGGIGTLLYQYQGLGNWREVGLLVFLIALVVWAMDSLSVRLRKCVA